MCWIRGYLPAYNQNNQLVPGYSRVCWIPGYLPEYGQTNQVVPGYCRVCWIPGYLPEYGQTNQVWYLGNPECVGYAGTRMTKTASFGTRVLQSALDTRVPTRVWPNQPDLIPGYSRVCWIRGYLPAYDQNSQLLYPGNSRVCWIPGYLPDYGHNKV